MRGVGRRANGGPSEAGHGARYRRSSPLALRIGSSSSPAGEAPLDTSAGVPEGRAVKLRIELDEHEPELVMKTWGDPIDLDVRLEKQRNRPAP